jgi:hypothetical protein
MCGKDADCTAGANGRCDESMGGPAGCYCTYDMCEHDTDCSPGDLCACHGSPFVGGGNSCLPGSCRVDSDCGNGGYCSPSHGGPLGCGGLTGYYCHTASDQCVNDTDCGNGFQVCGWSPADSRWECLMQELCP